MIGSPEGRGDVFFLRLVRCLFFFDAFVKLNVKGFKAALVEALRDSAAPTFLLLMFDCERGRVGVQL